MAIDSDLIRGHVDTIILKTLASGDKYGYEIIKEIEVKSGGTYELKQPTLYSCLKRLESQGFISAYWVNSDIGGKRHYYKLTELGRNEYDNNMREWLSSRSIIDNLIAENADEVLPEVTTNFVPLTGNENVAFRKKTDDERQTLSDNETISTETPSEKDNDICAKDGENLNTDGNESTSVNNEDEVDNSNTEAEYTNPFAEFSNIDEDDGLMLETDEQDLKLIEEYYNTDENQFDIFDEIDNSAETTEGNAVPFAESEEYAQKSNDEIEPEKELFDDCNKTEQDDDDNGRNLDDVVVRSENHNSIKFNIKDYRLNNSNYFSQVKDEVGGSGFENEYSDEEKDDEPTTIQEETNTSSLFDEIINADDDDDDVYDNDENDESESEYNANEINEDEFEITRHYNYFSSSSFDNDESEENGSENVYDEQEIDDEYSSKLNFGYDAEEEQEESTLVFGTNEESGEEDLDTDISTYNYNYDNNESESENAEDELENYATQNFTLRNEEELTSSYQYGYDEEESLSESRDISIRETYSAPVENEKNEVVAIEPEVDPYREPIYPDPDATTNLFVDNKRSFVPQYTDNDSKQLLNTLSSYGSIRFSPTNKGSHTPKHITSTIDELRTNFSNAGIDVRVYQRRPKESAESKNYILTNKLKLFTSILSYAIVSLFLVIGYLIAGPIGYTDLHFVPTSLSASSYLFIFLGTMLAIPAVFATIYFLNPTKKLRPRYSAKIAIIFSILFAVQCLVIIYAINIPFGLYSFSQIDYNHLLWYLPAICTLYIPIHTLVYTILFNTKKFHV